MKLLSFGEVIWDVYPDAVYLGGAPLNFAAHASCQGADAYVVSAVGRDELGRAAMEKIESKGVKTKYISELSQAETGKCIVTLDENAVPDYNLLTDVAYDYIQKPELVERFDVIAFGTLALRGENNRRVLEQILKENVFSDVFTDLNIRPPFYSKESILFCLENATIVKISDEELPIVAEAIFGGKMDYMVAAEALSERFAQIKIIIITRGADGSCAYDCAEKSFCSADAPKTEVVSTVGAGDSFGATFLTQYFAGRSLQACLDIASRVSAFVVSQKDAIPEEMPEFIKTIGL